MQVSLMQWIDKVYGESKKFAMNRKRCVQFQLNGPKFDCYVIFLWFLNDFSHIIESFVEFSVRNIWKPKIIYKWTQNHTIKNKSSLKKNN